MAAGDTPLVEATGDPTLAHLTNPYASKIYLVEAAPVNSSGTAQNVRLSSDRFATGADDTPAHQLYKARLVSPYNVENSILNNGRPGGRSIPAYGEVSAANPDGELDDYVSWSWADREFKIKAGTEELSYSQFPTVFDGFAPIITASEVGLSWSLEGKHGKLARPSLQANRYRGMGPMRPTFDGTNDYATLGTYTSVATVAFECWFRCTGSNTAAAIQILAGHGTAWGATTLDWYVQISNSGILTLFIHRENASPASIVATPDYRDSTDHHLAFLITPGTNASKLYIDGELIGSATAPTFSEVTAGTLFIGSLFGGGSNFFKGEIQETRFWKVSRSQSQFVAAMNAPLAAPSSSDLFAYHKMNDGTGTTLTATIGTNGTLTGATWTGSYQGNAILAGAPKPLAFGHSYQVEPTLIDPTNLIYQVHDGTVDDITSVQERGAEITDAGDVADLYATSVSAGQFKTDLSRGLFKLGSSPTGQMTATVQGDEVSTTYVNTAGDILSRILVTRLGLTTTDVDTASLTALASAQPAEVGLFLSTSGGLVNTDEVCDRLIETIGGYWTATRAGQLVFGLVTDPADGSSTYTITEADVRLESIERVTVPPPVKLVRLGYKPYGVTLDFERSATSLGVETRQDYAQEERFAQADDPSVADIYRNADEWTYSTLFRDYADAATEAARQLTLYGTAREAYRIPLAKGFFRFEIGDVVTLELDRFGLGSGKQFMVVGLTEDAKNDDVVVTVWG